MKYITILIYVVFAIILLALSGDIGGTYLFAFIVMGLFIMTCLAAGYCEETTFKYNLLNKRIYANRK